MDDLDGWLSESYPRAYRTACLLLRVPADADDAVQEAILRVWRFRDAIPSGDGREAWLYRTVVNACLSRRRRADEHAPSSGLLAALDRLPEHLRVPVVLRYYTGLSDKAIATAIQRRPGTVRSRLAEARSRLSGDPALNAWTQLEVAQ